MLSTFACFALLTFLLECLACLLFVALLVRNSCCWCWCWKGLRLRRVPSFKNAPGGLAQGVLLVRHGDWTMHILGRRDVIMVTLLSALPFSLPHASKLSCFKLQPHASNSQRLRRPLIFWNLFLLKHIILPHYSLARLSHWRKDCLAHDRFKTSWAISLSPFFVLRKFPIKGVADGCRLQKGWGKIAKLGYSWPSVSTCGSRIVAFKLETHFDAHWPGEDDYRPARFFPNGLVEPKVLVSKECAEGCRM